MNPQIRTTFYSKFERGDEIQQALAGLPVPAGHTLSMGERQNAGGIFVTLLRDRDSWPVEEGFGATVGEAVLVAKRILA